MLNPLIQYELDMAHQYQGQLRRKAALWHLAHQAARSARGHRFAGRGRLQKTPHAGGDSVRYWGLCHPAHALVGALSHLAAARAYAASDLRVAPSWRARCLRAPLNGTTGTPPARIFGWPSIQ